MTNYTIVLCTSVGPFDVNPQFAMNECSVTQNREERKIRVAADETAMMLGVSVDAESRVSEEAERKYSDVPHLAAETRSLLCSDCRLGLHICDRLLVRK